MLTNSAMISTAVASMSQIVRFNCPENRKEPAAVDGRGGPKRAEMNGPTVGVGGRNSPSLLQSRLQRPVGMILGYRQDLGFTLDYRGQFKCHDVEEVDEQRVAHASDF